MREQKAGAASLVQGLDGGFCDYLRHDQRRVQRPGTPYEKTAGARLNQYEHDPNGLQDCTVGKNDIVLFR